MEQTTIEDYLRYIPPNIFPAQRLSSTRTTVPKKARSLLGVQISTWKSFGESVHRERRKALERKAEKLIPLYEAAARAKSCANEAQVEDALRRLLFQPLERVMSALGVDSSFITRPEEAILDPDYAWCSQMTPSSPTTATTLGGNEVPKILMEVKTFWAFDPPDDLVMILVNKEAEAKDDPGGKVQRAVSQIYGYMLCNHLRYGVLATFQKFVFLRRGGENSGSEEPSVPTLEITDVIWRDQTRHEHTFTLMEAWVSLLMIAHSDHVFTSPYPSPLKTGENVKIGKELRIGNLYFGKRMTRSQLGTVVEGGIRGRYKNDSVIKVVDTSKSSVKNKKLQEEVSTYESLRSLQGIDVPEVHGSWLCDGWIRVLVLSNCGEEVQPHQFLEFYDRILEMVQRIHGAGVAHGDLAFRNILVHREGKLTIIDFSDAKLKNLNERQFSDYCKNDLNALIKLRQRARREDTEETKEDKKARGD